MAAAAPTTPVDDSKLNPAVKVFLDKLNALPKVEPGSIPPHVRRDIFQTFAGSHAGDSIAVRRVEDVTVSVSYGGTAAERRLRVYQSRTAEERAAAGSPLAPMVLFLHGGGWHAGSITTHDTICRRLLAGAGDVILASFDYRMAPDLVAPTAVFDCLQAFAWLQDCGAAMFGGDASRVLLAGDSAGANIVTAAAVQMVLALQQQQQQQAASSSGSGSSSSSSVLFFNPLTHKQPAGLMLFYPSLDLTASSGPSYKQFAEGYYLRLASVEHYVDIYLHGYGAGKKKAGEEGVVAITDPIVSPLLAPAEVLKQLPPTFITAAGFDPLLDDARAFAVKLAEQGVPVELQVEEGFIHAWMQLITAVPEVSTALEQLGKKLGGLAREGAAALATKRA